MSKRHVQELQQVYSALFKDVLYAYPTLGDELEKDQVRLHRAVEQRGLHVFTVDLPALGKHFDRCLANGEYKLSGLPLSKRFSGRVPIPKFLRGLYLLVFDNSGRLKEDYDVQAIFFLRQLLYAAKKTAIQCSDGKIRTEVRNFLVTDSELPTPDNFWHQKAARSEDVARTYKGTSQVGSYFANRVTAIPDPILRSELSALLVKFDFVSNLISTTLGEYVYSEWSFRHGPGAISEVTGPYNKYCFTNWSERLENVFPLADCGFHNHASWADSIAKREISSKEPCSRLIDVLKTYTRPRLIAAEPSEHQWCQQNIWHFLRSRTSGTWISSFIRFTDQTRNQMLCQRGSGDGSLATLDLSEASDRVTCQVVGELFRANPSLLLALQATRTRYVRQSQLRDAPEIVELRKFSTMGSACTFPVESLTFLAIVLAAVMAKRHLRPTLANVLRLREEVAIFGDDLIVPEDSRELVCEALKVFHFKVNVEKSFWTGKFRESCGVDSYAGINVTPVYWKAFYTGKPESYTSMVATCNNFYSKLLLHTAAHLESTIRGYKCPLVPYHSGVCGLKSFVTPDSPGPFITRWNTGLQRTEIRVPMPRASVSRSPITDDSALLQFFTEDPQPHTMWVGGVTQRPITKLRYRWVPLSDLAPSK